MQRHSVRQRMESSWQIVFLGVGFALLLQTEFGKPWVMVGAAAQGPKILAVGIFDRQVIDAGETPCH